MSQRIKLDPRQQAAIESQHEQYLAKGMEMIHSPQTRDSILELLRASDPVDALSKTLVMVLHKVDEAARSANLEVEDAAKLMGASELLTQLYEIGEAAKIMKLMPDEIHLALAAGIQNYVKDEVVAGRINPQKLAETMKKNLSLLSPKEKADSLLALKKIEQTGKEYAARNAGG